MYLCLINQYALETHAKVEAQLHAIFTLMYDGEWSASRCADSLIFTDTSNLQGGTNTSRNAVHNWPSDAERHPARTVGFHNQPSHHHCTNRWPVWQLCTTCRWTLTKGGLHFQSIQQQPSLLATQKT